MVKAKRVSPSFTQVFTSGIMPIISSVAGLAKAKEICRVAKVKGSLIMGDKLVTQALANMDAHVTLLIVATDGGCADHVATATERQIPILKLSTRSDVGEIVGYPSVSSCVLSFLGDEALLVELLQLG
ncbi:hypothetical protein Bca4012_021030 [Brassica carinata]